MLTIREKYDLPQLPTREELTPLLGYDNLFCLESMGYRVIEIVEYNGSCEFITTRRGHYEEPVQYSLSDMIDIASGLGYAPISKFDLVIDLEPIEEPLINRLFNDYCDWAQDNAGIMALAFLVAYIVLDQSTNLF